MTPRVALKKLVYAMEPETFPGQQDENLKCPLCGYAFRHGPKRGRKQKFRLPENHKKSCPVYKALETLGEPEVLDAGPPPAQGLEDVEKVLIFLNGLAEQGKAISKRNRKGSFGTDIRYLDLWSLPNITEDPKVPDPMRWLGLGPHFCVGDVYEGYGGCIEFDQVTVPVSDLVGGDAGKTLRDRIQYQNELVGLEDKVRQAQYSMGVAKQAHDNLKKEIDSGEVGGRKYQRQLDSLSSTYRSEKSKLKKAQEELAEFKQQRQP